MLLCIIIEAIDHGSLISVTYDALFLLILVNMLQIVSKLIDVLVLQVFIICFIADGSVFFTCAGFHEKDIPG